MAKFLNSILVAVIYASALVNAAPWPTSSQHSTHRVRSVGQKRELQLESFHPESTYKTFGEGVSKRAPLGAESLDDIAVAFTAEEANVPADSITFVSGYQSDATGVEHAYLKQTHDGITVLNTAANVAILGESVTSFGSSFIDTESTSFPSSEPTVTLDSVIAEVEAALDGTQLAEIEPTLGYLARSDASPALAHVVQIKNEDAFTWYEAYVDAHSGELLSVTDFVSDLSYTVLPIKKIALPNGLETLTNPENTASSPNGWVTGSATAGNNVVSYKSSSSSTASSPFTYKYDDTLAPTNTNNVAASKVNAFYLINTLHDIWYQYGFTEKSYNFQTDNFSKGGSGNDRVLMSVQDSSGTNNANFATPPDGQSGTCRMYIWTQTSPNRDGVFDTSIPVHEYTHGLTNRLTGGGTGRCLQTTEAGGMGEGWSDAMAEWANLKSATVPDYLLAEYVYGKGGIRTYPYSTSHTVNPLMYSSIKTLNEVHDIGEVWAVTLHGVLTALVNKLGYNANAGTTPSATEGNAVFLHLFLDALALQPCNPTLVQARAAWVQADVNRYSGANKCTLWKAFADRGLGVNAASYKDDLTVPSGC